MLAEQSNCKPRGWIHYPSSQVAGLSLANSPHSRNDRSDSPFNRYAFQAAKRVKVFRRHRNLEMLVSLVPIDVLQRIFGYVTDSNHGSMGNFFLGQICRKWRSAALNHPALWSDIVATDYCTNLHLLELLLTQSKGAELDVQLIQAPSNIPTPHSPPPDKDVVVFRPNAMHVILASCLRRIRSLRLAVSQKTLNEELLAYLKLPAPRLQTLVITELPSSDLTPSRPILADMPLLQELTVQGLSPCFALSLATSAKKTLKHLAMRSPCVPELLDSTELLEVLRILPELSTLDLGSNIVTPSQHRYPPVHIPSLWCLRLSGEVHDCTWLLDHLHLSPRITIDMALLGEQPATPLDFEALGSRLGAILHTPEQELAPLGNAACFWTQRNADNYTSAIYFMLTDSPVGVDEHLRASNTDHITSDSRVPEDTEVFFDRFRYKVPMQRGNRSIHIRMLDNSLSQSGPDPVRHLWSELRLYDVQSLTIGGIPKEEKSYGGLFTVRRLQPALMNFVCTMTSVRRLRMRGWDSFWIRQLLTAKQADYSDTDVVVPEPLFCDLHTVESVDPLPDSPPPPLAADSNDASMDCEVKSPPLGLPNLKQPDIRSKPSPQNSIAGILRYIVAVRKASRRMFYAPRMRCQPLPLL
ncbi:hypothetical protein BXZ70DRAFT_386051 [Cristinia sonorae]|uniref:F-box domain-containing protein n=1 Tax=Cristinia sonorae TaxID=1940300 RepID=A0A8K0UJI9_9AGAR|nr:hypothetical protein BXZ70DRAFT_386051 [Cristinia sonorae]